MKAMSRQRQYFGWKSHLPTMTLVLRAVHKVVILVLLLPLFACASPTPLPTKAPTPEPPPTAEAITPTAEATTPTVETITPTESPAVVIPLGGPLTNRNAEVSGMAWFGEQLIMLPQYPQFSSSGGDGSLYALSKAEILAFLEGDSSTPLVATPIHLIAPGLATTIQGFEGFEAIAFGGDRAYLTIEANTSEGMKGYLVSGTITDDLSELALDVSSVTEIELQASLSNMSDETILITGDGLATLYEANGANVNPSPVAHLYDPSLTLSGTLPFPTIEYRVTDATELDAENHFWVINYFYPGDTKLQPGPDALAELYGQGPTHSLSEPVERLVELQYTASGIKLLDSPPIQLELLADDARNWEGLVRLDERGFLLITDKFPETILGFVAYPHKD